MNKLLTILFLSLVAAKASAQLNTFESGQTIRADEMNENFEYLERSILEKNECGYSDIAGTWMYLKVTEDRREWQLGEIEFKQDSVVEVRISYQPEGDEDQGVGSFSIDENCLIEFQVDLGGDCCSVLGRLSDEASSIRILIGEQYEGATRYDARILTRFNR